MAKTYETYVAMITGACLGAAFSILYAPERGENIRGKIKRETDKTLHKLSDASKALGGASLESLTGENLSDIDKIIDNSITHQTHTTDEMIVILETKLLELKMGLEDIAHIDPR